MGARSGREYKNRRPTCQLKKPPAADANYFPFIEGRSLLRSKSRRIGNHRGCQAEAKVSKECERRLGQRDGSYGRQRNSLRWSLNGS